MSLTIAKNQIEQRIALDLLDFITLELQGKKYALQIYATASTVCERQNIDF